MRNVVNKIKSLITKERITCPCGYKTTSEIKALKHLAKHRTGTGNINPTTGMVVW